MVPKGAAKITIVLRVVHVVFTMFIMSVFSFPTQQVQSPSFSHQFLLRLSETLSIKVHKLLSDFPAQRVFTKRVLAPYTKKAIKGLPKLI